MAEYKLSRGLNAAVCGDGGEHDYEQSACPIPRYAAEGRRRKVCRKCGYENYSCQVPCSSCANLFKWGYEQGARQ